MQLNLIVRSLILILQIEIYAFVIIIRNKISYNEENVLVIVFKI